MALIELRGVARSFATAAGEAIPVLRGIDLSIEAGEMVAIVGASGSGKSTLMNILGCLDRPSAGSYRVGGRETAALDPDALAALRREHFGFIFQRYHLLAELTALGNVEVPAIYAGQASELRQARAADLLDRLGMGGRLDFRPGALSGGQQQRVSIARALINDASVILADEPTGALDSASGAEVLRILDELHAEGRTIILVTHDMAVARRAGRIVEIRDGRILADRRNPVPATGGARGRAGGRAAAARRGLGAATARLGEAFRMAVLALLAHRLRSFLTMLGIIIGIAAVIGVVALGEGSRQSVLANIAGLGTNTLEIFPGKDMGDVRSGKIRTLVASDAAELGRQDFVAAVTPTVAATGLARIGAVEATTQISGVGEGYLDAKALTLVGGRFFDAADVAASAQVAVIDGNAAAALFPDGGDPVGQVVLFDKIPARIIGVVASDQRGFGGSQNLTAYMPYTTVQARITGDRTLRSVILRVADAAPMDLAQTAVTDFLRQRHRAQDFFIINTGEIRDAITSTTETMTLLIAAIAVISLVVGGIGVMNIMLVSVSERVGEIGVRMAVGARRSDILRQFLIEAVMVCLIGACLGLGLAFAFGLGFNALGMPIRMVYSPTAMLLAVASASLIGIGFGYLPARNASRLDPVAALAAV
ncbi:MAG: MacB family efflux pump subunit [Amaricoccus sp.]